MASGQEVKLMADDKGDVADRMNLAAANEPVKLQSREVEMPEMSVGDDTRSTTVPVIEERLRVDKKVVETAKVHISKVVYEDVDQYTIPYMEEHVTVERVQKNEWLNAMPPAVRYEGDVMIIPVLKEVAVVEKRIMLVEELRITRHQTEKTQTHEVSLRKEEVEVNRVEAGNLH